MLDKNSSEILKGPVQEEIIFLPAPSRRQKMKDRKHQLELIITPSGFQFSWFLKLYSTVYPISLSYQDNILLYQYCCFLLLF